MQLHSVNISAVILNVCTVGTWLLGFVLGELHPVTPKAVDPGL
jgi:hypothetical protein